MLSRNDEMEILCYKLIFVDGIKYGRWFGIITKPLLFCIPMAMKKKWYSRFRRRIVHCRSSISLQQEK